MIGRTASGFSGAELANRAGVTPQSMSIAVGSLLDRVLVVRTPHPTHGRVPEVRITAERAQLLERAQAEAKTVEDLDGREPDGAPPEDTMAWRFTGALITRHTATDTQPATKKGTTMTTMTTQQGHSQ